LILASAASSGGLLTAPAALSAQRQLQPARAITASVGLTQILGRPTDRSIALSVHSPTDVEAYVEYGTAPGSLTARTQAAAVKAGVPCVFQLDALRADTRYAYRLLTRQSGQDAFSAGTEHTFFTQRATGRTFTFALQGDSHPERVGIMYDPNLYRRTLANVQKDQPDFYVLMGDDFSVGPLLRQGQLTQEGVNGLYVNQRQFLSAIGGSVPLFLVNGNHEQAARFLLKGTADSAPLFSGRARTTFFPLPAPDDFYTGDTEQIEGIGLLRDYYAWTWGDALFVVIDPYWHSPAQVDPSYGADPGRGAAGRGARAAGARAGDGGAGRRQAANPRAERAGANRDWWGMTIGDAQYRWLQDTLTESKARYKFVFAHHVMGTGRGGVEMADLYEWGGKDRTGQRQFEKYRPGWELPIHQLMVKTGVTIFFQGHDHLFARRTRPIRPSIGRRIARATSCRTRATCV
jgi:hypothetical protein